MEITAPSQTFAVTDVSVVGVVRRASAQAASRLGFSETRNGEACIVATELANNLVRHAGQGQLVIQALPGENPPCLEFISLDKGPGMANVTECLRDGYSTAGGAGTGMGAIVRLSSMFDVFTQPGMGTVIVARICARDEPRSRWDIGAVCAARAGETFCGDAWAVRESEGRCVVLVTDGLGHGPMAAKASLEALRVFDKYWHLRPPELLVSLHGALRSTRGASVAVAELLPADGVVRYAAAGNIAGTLLNAKGSRSMISHNGTVGMEMPRVQEFQYPWSKDALLVMHSDGLQSRWALDKYPGLLPRHPALVASVLYRDFQRGRDDVTVLALRQAV